MLDFDLKVCSMCEAAKPATSEFFYRDKRLNHGLDSRCKTCSVEPKRYWERKNLLRRKRLNAEWEDEHKEERKGQKLKAKYNITLEQYEKMKIEQNYKCLLCKKIKPLYVDHDHFTGKVRGLLCNTCNSIIGFANDDEELLLDANFYLRNQKSKNCFYTWEL